MGLSNRMISTAALTFPETWGGGAKGEVDSVTLRDLMRAVAQSSGLCGAMRHLLLRLWRSQLVRQPIFASMPVLSADLARRVLRQWPALQ